MMYNSNNGKSNNARLLQFINATTTANSEEDVESLLLMMNPDTDKTKMGEIFNTNLGYNPIEYYDREYVILKLDEIIEDAPREIKSKLLEYQFDIIDVVMNHKENLDSDYLGFLLTMTVEEKTGWRSPNNKHALLNFKKEFESDEFEYEEDEEIEDIESDSDADFSVEDN